ncbi:hypothetical protein [Salmonella phage SD-1_S14]|nr:hypothetical protein [Salmonella phage SD-2_S15]WPK19117.1 hypothetical protein [Salmonella phage SD-6_S16]WPK19790.1 hypothetical protein [Salmonella phage SD-1_S14]WPK20814.1 hypothetical protein [Salmonella phage SD-15_S21]
MVDVSIILVYFLLSNFFIRGVFRMSYSWTT